MRDWLQPPFGRLQPFLVARRITPRWPHLFFGGAVWKSGADTICGAKMGFGTPSLSSRRGSRRRKLSRKCKKGLSLPCFPRFLPFFAAMVPCASFDIRISCIVLSITPAQVRYERGQGLCLHSGGVLPLRRVGAAGQPILHRGTDAPSACEATVKRK